MKERIFEPIELTAINKASGEVIDVDVMYSIKELKAFMSRYKKQYSKEKIKFLRVPIELEEEKEVETEAVSQLFSLNPIKS